MLARGAGWALPVPEEGGAVFELAGTVTGLLAGTDVALVMGTPFPLGEIEPLGTTTGFAGFCVVAGSTTVVVVPGVTRTGALLALAMLRATA